MCLWESPSIRSLACNISQMGSDQTFVTQRGQDPGGTESENADSDDPLAPSTVLSTLTLVLVEESTWRPQSDFSWRMGFLGKLLLFSECKPEGAAASNKETFTFPN